MLSRVNTGSTIITELRYLWNENPLLQLSTVTLRLQLIALILYYGTTKTLASLANVQNIQNGWRLTRAIYRRRRQMSPQYARHPPSGPLVNRWRLIRWIYGVVRRALSASDPLARAYSGPMAELP